MAGNDIPPLTKTERTEVNRKKERVLTILRAYWAEHGLPVPITEAWAQSHTLYNELWPNTNSHE